jgi:hypothetical protein
MGNWYKLDQGCPRHHLCSIFFALNYTPAFVVYKEAEIRAVRAGMLCVLQVSLEVLIETIIPKPRRIVFCTLHFNPSQVSLEVLFNDYVP